MKQIILFGSGGHAKSVIDCILRQNEYKIVGIVGRECDVGSCINGIEVNYTDSDIQMLQKENVREAFLAIGGLEQMVIREQIYETAQKFGLKFVNVIDPTAVISRDAMIGNGVFLGKNSVVNAGADVQDMTIINTGSIIEHDVVVGDFSHVAPGTVVCGEARIGRGTFIGANSTVIPGIRIGAGAVVGAGSVVTKDIADGIKAYGNPCEGVGAK